MACKTAAKRSGIAPHHRGAVDEVGTAVRKMGAQSVITSRTVADRFGLHTTDLEVLDLIYLRKQASAGDLANATGLSSGSVTALIDRLVRAGYIERCEDEADRRRVLVRIRQHAIEPIKGVYSDMQRRMFELWSGYSDRELQLIEGFISKSTALAVECCKSIRRSAPPRASKRRAPRTNRSNDGISRDEMPSVSASTTPGASRKRKQA